MNLGGGTNIQNIAEGNLDIWEKFCDKEKKMLAVSSAPGMGKNRKWIQGDLGKGLTDSVTTRLHIF